MTPAGQTFRAHGAVTQVTAGGRALLNPKKTGSGAFAQPFGQVSGPGRARRAWWRLCALGAALGVGLAACGPRLAIPPLPAPAAVGADTGAAARLARALAPVLFTQPDEPFGLRRVVAVVHPTRRVIGYHLLWHDDAHAAWIPGTIPTDEEVVWVGYDTTGAPTEVWTYWHGAILHTAWPRAQVAIAVQWGKHGSMPYGTPSGGLPRGRTLRAFWLYHWLGLPDLLLGRLERPGPGCFCHGYGRYRRFTEPLRLDDRVDLVLVTRDPYARLERIFGRPYSRKPAWPWRVDLDEVKGVT